MTFLQFWLVHKTFSLLSCDVCTLWLLLALPREHKPCAGCRCVGWQGWGCCTFHLQPQSHLRIKAVICWGERYLQTLRHCLQEPLSLPRRCFFSKHYVQQRCLIYQLLQQPKGHRARSQHMGGIGSGANSDRHHLPNFQVKNRSRQ